MFYELITLACPLLAIGQASEGVRAWASNPSTAGALLGCWRTEIGTLGRLLVLCSFDTREALATERDHALFSDRPFNAGSIVTALSMDSYAPFPFLPPARPGPFGAVCEFRT